VTGQLPILRVGSVRIGSVVYECLEQCLEASVILYLIPFRLRGAGQGYMLQTSSTSAELPISYGRIRPLSGELPKGTVIETILYC